MTMDMQINNNRQELDPDPLTGIEVDVLLESQIDATLDRQLREYLSTIFPEWSSIFAQRRAWHEAAPVFSILARRGDEILGHVGVVERTISSCWNWRYLVASFQGVSVAPAVRKTGLSHKILQKSLDASIARGYPFAILFCREPLVHFYQDLGWSLPDDSMIMWRDRALPIAMRSNCPMYRVLADIPLPEGPIDVHNPFEY
ncbi:MAG: GNAT family N-acetyltransferase [Planctomycetia bacterium]|nr:GNAT family N-acetyltransferase [Planctomycetia bacterium]